jgi:adenosylmethionine-8-amino-7-oxononanoate aminotransferase
MHPLAQFDHAHVWHPFTQMRDWLRREPITLVRGRGAVLEDVHGREYLDANSSIWTNLHGHNHPKLNAALRRQLGKVAHTSALGFANEPASRLAAQLVKAAAGVQSPKSQAQSPNRSLIRVFFSDDGSTAVEVALKLAYEFTRRTRGPKPEPRFLTLQGAYHGDTVGAVSLGHIDLFHKAYSGLLFKTDAVMAPYCYRCPFNRAKPERADAREYRRCNWECVGKVEAKLATAKRSKRSYAGFVFEPLMQGAAGMIPQPPGWLSRVSEAARAHGALLIADEVMTGFGRTGGEAGVQGCGGAGEEIPSCAPLPPRSSAPLFACQKESVQPDFLCLAKGLTGGYLPMAATLTTQKIFDAFLGEYAEFKSFFHGHSYTANQLGAAAGLASLELLASPASLTTRLRLEAQLRSELQSLWHLPPVGDIRQAGLVAGIELVKDWQTRRAFDVSEQAGIRVCEAMARRGVLTRPIGNVVVLMPPYCTTARQLHQMVSVLAESIEEVFPPSPRPSPFIQ